MTVSPYPKGLAGAFEKELSQLDSRIRALKSAKGLDAEHAAHVAQLAENAATLRKRVIAKLPHLRKDKRQQYAINAVASLADAVKRAEESVCVPMPPKSKKLMRGGARQLEDLEKHADKLLRSTYAKPGDAVLLKELKKQVLSLKADLMDPVRSRSLDMRMVAVWISSHKKEVGLLAEKIEKRRYLRKIGCPHHHHNIFDRFPIHKIIGVHRNWRKKPVAQIAKNFEVSDEHVISLARALGWPVIPESLEWWKENFVNAKVGEPVDVTEWAVEGNAVLQQTNSAIINRALADGNRIYAIPIRGARGGFRKWDLREDGTVEVDSAGAHEVSMSPRFVVAALLCALGEQNTRYMGYDEIGHGTDGSVEGVPVRTAHQLHTHLKLGADDTYLLMFRKQNELGENFAELKSRLTEILQKGASAKISFSVEGADEYGAVRSQSHPMLKNEVAEQYYHWRKDSD